MGLIGTEAARMPSAPSAEQTITLAPMIVGRPASVADTEYVNVEFLHQHHIAHCQCVASDGTANANTGR